MEALTRFLQAEARPTRMDWQGRKRRWSFAKWTLIVPKKDIANHHKAKCRTEKNYCVKQTTNYLVAINCMLAINDVQVRLLSRAQKITQTSIRTFPWAQPTQKSTDSIVFILFCLPCTRIRASQLKSWPKNSSRQSKTTRTTRPKTVLDVTHKRWRMPDKRLIGN